MGLKRDVGSCGKAFKAQGDRFETFEADGWTPLLSDRGGEKEVKAFTAHLIQNPKAEEQVRPAAVEVRKAKMNVSARASEMSSIFMHAPGLARALSTWAITQ